MISSGNVVYFDIAPRQDFDQLTIECLDAPDMIPGGSTISFNTIAFGWLPFGTFVPREQAA